MATSTVSVKGQITLPARIRRKLGIKPNDRVTIELLDDALLIKLAPDFFALEGFLGKALPGREERARARRGVASHARGGTR